MLSLDSSSFYFHVGCKHHPECSGSHEGREQSLSGWVWEQGRSALLGADRYSRMCELFVCLFLFHCIHLPPLNLLSSFKWMFPLNALSLRPSSFPDLFHSKRKMLWQVSGHSLLLSLLSATSFVTISLWELQRLPSRYPQRML